MNTGKNLFAKLQNADSPRGIWEIIDAGREYLRKCDSAERGWPPSLSVPVHWAAKARHPGICSAPQRTHCRPCG